MIVEKMWRIEGNPLNRWTRGGPGLMAPVRSTETRIGAAAGRKRAIMRQSTGISDQATPGICAHSEEIGRFSAYCSHSEQQTESHNWLTALQLCITAITRLRRPKGMVLIPNFIRSEFPITSKSETFPNSGNGFLQYEASR